MRQLAIEANTENLTEVLEFIDEDLKKAGCPAKIQQQIDIAVEELFVNIAHYAYDPLTGDAVISIEIEDDPLVAVITLTDQGTPYNPLAREDPDITLPADERPIGGLGVYMVKMSMDSVNYSYTDGKNILSIRKLLG